MLRYAAAFVLILSSLTAGCKAGGKNVSDAVATVNGVAISAKDLRHELELRAKKDPSFKATPAAVQEQLDVLIDRRILIQEAQDRRLTEDERFTQTIRTFWEQTLVRLLMDRFHREFSALSSVSEEEIQSYYKDLGEKATFQVFETASEAEAAAVAGAAKNGETVAWGYTVGPVRYSDIKADFLERAFHFGTGESGVFSNGKVSVVVRLVSKETDTPPALEAIRDKIKLRIAERKERRLFEQWLTDKRAAAKVEIRTDQFVAEAS